MGYNGTNRPSVGSNRQVREIGEITAAPNLNPLTPLIKGEESKESGGIQPPTTPAHGVSGFEQTDTHHRSKDESPAKRAIARIEGTFRGLAAFNRWDRTMPTQRPRVGRELTVPKNSQMEV
jgi:hypothetical protein